VSLVNNYTQPIQKVEKNTNTTISKGYRDLCTSFSYLPCRRITPSEELWGSLRFNFQYEKA